MSVFSYLPMDVVLHILQYDSRFVVKKGVLRYIGSIQPYDERCTVIRQMFRERKMLLREYWDAANRMNPRLVLPIGRYKEYIVYIYDAEFYNEDTEDTYYELVRELTLQQSATYHKKTIFTIEY